MTDTFTAGDRFSLTLDLLCKTVAGRIAGFAMSVAMIVAVWRRVRRIQGEIARLLVRFRAGRLGGPRARRTGGGGRVGRGARLLPVRFGWLLPLVPGEAACYAGQVRTVLAEEEMVALLAASPRARRVLAPLCRMLGIEAEVLAVDAVGGGSRDLGALAERGVRDRGSEMAGLAAGVAGVGDGPVAVSPTGRVMRNASGRCRLDPDG